MRPIKFRGFGSKKLFSEEKWYYGSLIIVCGEYGIQPPLIQLMDKVIPETVGQFTGCYDGTKWDELTAEEQSEFLASKKGDTAPKWQGKEIYENDIVKIRGGRIAVVRWQCCCFVLKVAAGVAHFIYYMIEDYADDIKIIGNVHDNPELVQP